MVVLPRGEDLHAIQGRSGTRRSGEKCGLRVGGNKTKREAVVAPAVAGGCGTVFEDVTLMAATLDTVIFGSRPDELEVRLRREMLGYDGEETRPTGTAVVFHFGTE